MLYFDQITSFQFNIILTTARPDNFSFCRIISKLPLMRLIQINDASAMKNCADDNKLSI